LGPRVEELQRWEWTGEEWLSISCSSFHSGEDPGWAVTILTLLALGATMAIGSGGVPPWGPMFGGLALVAAVQFLLLGSYDLGPNSDPGHAEGGARPLQAERPGRT
jgi:hypothetical protein